jgi:hypothetical protein
MDIPFPKKTAGNARDMTGWRSGILLTKQVSDDCLFIHPNNAKVWYVRPSTVPLFRHPTSNHPG